MCHENAYFPYSKDLVVSHVYSYIPYSKELVVPCFLTLFYSKDLIGSHEIDTFCNQKCVETVKQQNPLKYSKNLANSPVSIHCLLGSVG